MEISGSRSIAACKRSGSGLRVVGMVGVPLLDWLDYSDLTQTTLQNQIPLEINPPTDRANRQTDSPSPPEATPPAHPMPTT